jgi:hypothetical protein
MTRTPADLRRPTPARRGRVEFVDVPPATFLALDGVGDEDGAAFRTAARALRAVSAAVEPLAPRAVGADRRSRPLEALWWEDDPARGDLLAALALGVAGLGTGSGGGRRWRALIGQPDWVDDAILARAVARAAAPDRPDVARVRRERWQEGRAAQVLHVGPDAGRAPAVAALHDAIEAAGLRPRGRHHRIDLTDPEHTPPGRMRTLLRQPVI